MRTGWRGRVRSVFVKEVRDHARDIRSMTLSLIFPLLGPVMIGFMLNATTGGGRIADATAERPITIAAMGTENAPELVAFLQENGVTLKAAPADDTERQRLVRRGNIGAVLVIPPEARGKDVHEVQILVDQTKPFSTVVTGILVRRIAEFSRERVVASVTSAGLDEAILEPITIAQTNVGKSRNVAGLFYRMMPPLVLFMVFMGAVYVAIDVTVGERERGSLEPLLTAPLDRWELLSGKAMTTMVFTAAILAVHLTAFKLILDMVTSGMQGADPPPTVASLLTVYVLVLPLMALAVLVQMSIGAITRSTKEAQIYLGLLPMVPLIPSLVMTFSPPESPVVLAAIPILGQAALMQELVQNEPVAWSHLALSMAATVLAAMFAFSVSVRLFRREQILFG